MTRALRITTSIISTQSHANAKKNSNARIRSSQTRTSADGATETIAVRNSATVSSTCTGATHTSSHARLNRWGNRCNSGSTTNARTNLESSLDSPTRMMSRTASAIQRQSEVSTTFQSTSCGGRYLSMGELLTFTASSGICATVSAENNHTEAPECRLMRSSSNRGP